MATALTAGAVDGLIGAVDDRLALALFGFAVATGALSLRWWQLQRISLRLPEKAPVVYLKDDSPEPFYGVEPSPSARYSQPVPGIDYSESE